MASNNLGGSRIATAQSSGQHTASNDADNTIDSALTEAKTIAVDNTNAVVVTSTVLASGVQHRLINGATSPTADVTVTVSSTKRGLFILVNELSYTASISVSGQSLPAAKLQSGAWGLFQSDGSNVRPIAVNNGIPLPVVFGGLPPAYSAGVDGLFVIPVARHMRFPSTAAGSTGKAKVAATAQTDFTVNKNAGSSFVTVRFAASGTVPTFVSVTQTDFAPGDWIEVKTQATADATLAQLGITLLFTPL